MIAASALKPEKVADQPEESTAQAPPRKLP
jgi:hypothetical protein